MTRTTTTSFQIHALPQTDLDRMRSSARDGRDPAAVRLVAAAGEKLRCCLRNARAGELILLVNYEPEIPASPYRETGAVYVHAEACPQPASRTDYPSDWLDLPQVLRAYDGNGWIHPATRVHDGTDPQAVIEAMLSDRTVVQIHSRNIAYGCYMFAVTR
jgi:hypothetical protein